ncbi:CDK5 regulatory subunit-associated protein 3 [Phytophthora infestans]|uniref:CDK5 regulatory subunit-associated protein 3 n=1 Tax=Phytophthora infestans TaxID=4787 RepID=A0A833SLP6_PHYIN|nr:CDK5 regulatory subunit-associated protein 3 [Phytophthora infestans]
MADKRKLPIDIQYKQLLEALVDRRIVPNKWLEQHKQIRDAIAALYLELPLASEALSKFRSKKPSHEDLNYFDCKFIFQCLEQSDEGASKNFFGQYTSPVLKRWSALIRQYQKNNVFAAETARIIAQNTAFEIPFLKKSIQQNEKQVADNNRKMADLTRSIAEYKRKLETSCADMGIAGENFREELRRLPMELPSLFDGVAKAICSDEIATAIEYHQALQAYLHDCEIPVVVTESISSSSSKKKKKSKKQVEAAEEPEVTTDEPFELVLAPHKFFAAIEELRNASNELVETTATLDFEAEAAEISWDISLDDSGTAEVGEIDWGIETVASTEPAEITVDDAPVEIDWDITTSDAVEPVNEVSAPEAADVVEPVPITTGQATRVGLLDDNEFRTRVLNDLLELRAFLRQRLVELSGSDSVAFANQFQGSSSLLEQQSTAKIEELQAAVDGAVSLLTSKRLQQLVLIKTSERYLDRHVASLEMLTKHMDKCGREIHALEDKNVDLIDATKNVQPQINALVATTKKLKKELEAALPPLFKGYKVNIVGEVNSL